MEVPNCKTLKGADGRFYLVVFLNLVMDYKHG